MKKSLRNLVVGAVMAATVITASATAFAGQYVQTDMNFRSGASTSSTIIGSVPAGAQVEVLDLKNGWNLIRYNGRTGYIHGGNLGDSYVAKQSTNTKTSTSTNTSTSTTTNPAIVVIKACSSRPARDSRRFRTATRIPTAAILNTRSTSKLSPPNKVPRQAWSRRSVRCRHIACRIALRPDLPAPS